MEQDRRSVGPRDVIAPEDNFLCHHEWVDMYGGNGVDKDDITISLQAFFCKWCLAIRIRAYDAKRYYINPEAIREFEDGREPA